LGGRRFKISTVNRTIVQATADVYFDQDGFKIPNYLLKQFDLNTHHYEVHERREIMGQDFSLWRYGSMRVYCLQEKTDPLLSNPKIHNFCSNTPICKLCAGSGYEGSCPLCLVPVSVHTV
ncbi:hypothetical protein RvY_02221, partial [Ramazzottius varieornatus]